MGLYKDMGLKLLAAADVEVSGKRPGDIHVHNDAFYKQVMTRGSLGLGESYMEGLWDSDALDVFFYKVLFSRIDKRVRSYIMKALHSILVNKQRIGKAFEIGKRHYDIGNDLYELMLDKRMVYSCAYWKGTHNLDKAQENKLDLICRKLQLRPGETVLDIGCGWGSFAAFAASKYKVNVVGITVSKEQQAMAFKRCKGLPVTIRLMDYRDLEGTYDKIVSIGMFEHVGFKNYRKYMHVVHEHLKDDGLFLLHTIGQNNSSTRTDPWIDKYIFPGGMLPSITQIASAIKGVFVLEDWHNFGIDYDRTLMAWYRNFTKAWPKLTGKYTERFYRMWSYYLLCCAGSFRARRNQLWQLVLSKRGLPGGYAGLR